MVQQVQPPLSLPHSPRVGNLLLQTKLQQLEVFLGGLLSLASSLSPDYPGCQGQIKSLSSELSLDPSVDSDAQQ